MNICEHTRNRPQKGHFERGLFGQFCTMRRLVVGDYDRATPCTNLHKNPIAESKHFKKMCPFGDGYGWRPSKIVRFFWG